MTRSLPKPLKRFLRSVNAVLGFVIALLLVGTAVFAPLLIREDPLKVDFSKLSRRLEAPGESSLMGRDHFGRDIYSRIVYGTRVSLIVGFSAVALGALVGSGLGLAAGFFGGVLDEVIMRITDILYAFPAILLTEAGLSFLGLGVQPPTPSWGGILAEGREFLRTAPYMMNFAGLAILLAVMSFDLLGDGLRDALDPKSKLK